jgi:hypothetical protein
MVDVEQGREARMRAEDVANGQTAGEIDEGLA